MPSGHTTTSAASSRHSRASERGGGGDPTVEDHDGGPCPAQHAFELLVARRQPDQVEALRLEHETEKPVVTLGLAEDDLHPSLWFHGQPSRIEARSYAETGSISAGRSGVGRGSYGMCPHVALIV